MIEQLDIRDRAVARLTACFRHNARRIETINLDLSRACALADPGGAPDLDLDLAEWRDEAGVELEIDFIPEGGALGLAAWTHKERLRFPACKADRRR